MTEKLNNLKEHILSDIREGRLTMRPRAYFLLRAVAAVLLALVALAVSVFIVNFILFSIRINSADAFLGFGLHGLGAFLRFFPWGLLLVDVLLLLSLQRLLRTFSWGYSLPGAYLLAALVVLSAATAVALDRATPLNDRLFEMREGLPPPFRDFYRQVRRPEIESALRGFSPRWRELRGEIPTTTGVY